MMQEMRCIRKTGKLWMPLNCWEGNLGCDIIAWNAWGS